jgi:hypothetical protein
MKPFKYRLFKYGCLVSIKSVSITKLTLNEFQIQFIADTESGDIRWRMTFSETNTRTLSPNCPFTLNKVQANFVFYRDYAFEVSGGA